MYTEKFEKIIEIQKERVKAMKAQGDFISFEKLDKIIIGVCGGDGIGPAITGQARRVLEYMLADEKENGKIEFRSIDNLTIEYRAKVM
jgi:isocitrate dehydrogenase (NAD+)